jgi:hypothetical protein
VTFCGWCVCVSCWVRFLCALSVQEGYITLIQRRPSPESPLSLRFFRSVGMGRSEVVVVPDQEPPICLDI